MDEIIKGSDSLEETSGNSNNQNETATVAPKGTLDQVVDYIAKAVASLVSSKTQNDAKACVRDVLNTIFTMCSVEEYDLGLRVDGELFRYSDYEAPARIADLLVAKKVVVRDVATAKDFLDRKKYIVSGKALSPADFKLKCKKVCGMLRVNPTFQTISRPEIALMSEAAQYASNGGKVADRTQKQLYFLTLKSDDEASIALGEWAKSIAVELFS